MKHITLVDSSPIDTHLLPICFPFCLAAPHWVLKPATQNEFTYGPPSDRSFVPRIMQESHKTAKTSKKGNITIVLPLQTFFFFKAICVTAQNYNPLLAAMQLFYLNIFHCFRYSLFQICRGVMTVEFEISHNYIKVIALQLTKPKVLGCWMYVLYFHAFFFHFASNFFQPA